MSSGRGPSGSGAGGPPSRRDFPIRGLMPRLPGADARAGTRGPRPPGTPVHATIRDALGPSRIRRAGKIAVVDRPGPAARVGGIRGRDQPEDVGDEIRARSGALRRRITEGRAVDVSLCGHGGPSAKGAVLGSAPIRIAPDGARKQMEPQNRVQDKKRERRDHPDARRTRMIHVDATQFGTTDEIQEQAGTRAGATRAAPRLSGPYSLFGMDFSGTGRRERERKGPGGSTQNRKLVVRRAGSPGDWQLVRVGLPILTQTPLRSTEARPPSRDPRRGSNGSRPRR